MRRTLSVVLGTLLLLAMPAPADAGGPLTWRVGPDRELRTPSAAAAVARDGDTIAGNLISDRDATASYSIDLPGRVDVGAFEHRR